MTLEKVIETLRYLQREYNYDREVEVACDFAVVAVKKLAIATLSHPPAPPEGWVMVPERPTHRQYWSMLAAAHRVMEQYHCSILNLPPTAQTAGRAIEAAWEAMLAYVPAAPKTPAPPEGWQPIETAPEDIDVLLWADGDFIVGGYFGAREQWETPDLQEICDPTHWRPLPAPPAPETP